MVAAHEAWEPQCGCSHSLTMHVSMQHLAAGALGCNGLPGMRSGCGHASESQQQQRWCEAARAAYEAQQAAERLLMSPDPLTQQAHVTEALLTAMLSQPWTLLADDKGCVQLAIAMHASGELPD